MDVPDCADQGPESISIARCRELLCDDAETMSDEEVGAVARHAETLAHILIVVALQDTRHQTYALIVESIELEIRRDDAEVFALLRRQTG
jgi:hypothetical protein